MNKTGKGEHRVLKSVLFGLGMVIVLVAGILISRMDRPPATPLDEDHQEALGKVELVPKKQPKKDRVPAMNAHCLECHPEDELPMGHPIEHSRFECGRCHTTDPGQP